MWFRIHSFPNSGQVITKQQLQTIQRRYSLLSFACVEYGLIALLISIGIIGALAIIGSTLGGLYVAIGNALGGVV
jgi:Flp pilus assembly pilin Flp